MALAVHSPEELVRELKSADPPPVLLLAGPDAFRMERTARWLRDKAVAGEASDFNVDVLHADERTPAQIAAASQEFAMFGGRRCVWVRHAEALPSGAAIEPLLKYLDAPNPGTVLILSANKLDKRLKLTAACAHAGRVVEFAALSGGALFAQLARQAKEYGIAVTPEALELLVEFVGDDLAELDSELAKLALQDGAGDAPIGPEQLRALVARSRDVDAFGLADLLDRRRPAEALAQWFELRRAGGDVMGTAAILGWRIRQLAQLRAALDEEGDPERAARAIGLAPWQARRAMPLVRSLDAAMAQRTLGAWREADRRAKSSSLGAGLAYDLALLDWASAEPGPA